MPDRLAYEFVGSSVIRFWASLGIPKRFSALVQKGFTHLKVTLPGIAESFGDFGRLSTALTFDEHRQLESDIIILWDLKGASSADKLTSFKVKLSHEVSPGNKSHEIPSNRGYQKTAK